MIRSKPNAFLTLRVVINDFEFEIDSEHEDPIGPATNSYRVARYINSDHANDDDAEPVSVVRVERDDFLAMLALAQANSKSSVEAP